MNKEIQEEIQKKILLAGNIESQVKEYAKNFIKKDMPLLEIAEKIEGKIIELGGKIAFPTNLSIDEIAAHYTPSYNDETLAHGLLKVDLGVHVDGWIADSAFSLDLDNLEENKELIKASEEALKAAIECVKGNKNLGEIGKTIQQTIERKNFTPIVNLTGHQINRYELHAGITILNVANIKKETLDTGIYAIEPFVTTGSGKVYEAKPSGIYTIRENKNVRNNEARILLDYINKEYKTLPFCTRWLVKKFDTKALFLLKHLEMNGNLYQYPQLIESSHAKVSQTEHTILIDEHKKVIIITE